ncbi:hypothetical protein M1N79_01580 [Dehalococcoidia bacterium]|nr:hypothetical protein [Dehalococcoidia bacterium]
MKNKCLVALTIIVLVALTSTVLILARAYTNQSNRIDAIDTVYHHLIVDSLRNLSWMYKQWANTIMEIELEEDKPIWEQERPIALGLLSRQIFDEVRRLMIVNSHLGGRQMQMPRELDQIGIRRADTLSRPLSLEERRLLAEAFKSAFTDIWLLLVDFQDEKDADSIRKFDQYIMEILSDLKPLLER